MDPVVLPLFLNNLSRDQLVSLSKMVNPSWGTSRGKWPRRKLIERLVSWDATRHSPPVLSVGVLMKKKCSELRAEIEALTGAHVSKVPKKAVLAARLLQLKKGKQMILAEAFCRGRKKKIIDKRSRA